MADTGGKAAITLVVSGETAHHITALWDEASRLEDDPSMEALAYAPHFTLAAYDASHLDQLRGIVARIAREIARMPIKINSLQIFDADPIVIWAAPESENALRRLQQSVTGRIEAEPGHEHYYPENWVAHCSLATTVKRDRRAEALRFVSAGIEPFEIVLDRVELVTFPPVRLIETAALK